MVAILGGLGAAVAWALSGLLSSRSSRILDPVVVVAWVALLGLLAIAPFVLAAGVPERLEAGAVGWLVLAGAGNILGLLLVFSAYRAGAAVVLVAPLVATQGAIAALIAIAGGENVSAAVAATLGAIALGVSLAAVPPRRDAAAAGAAPEPGPASPSFHTGHSRRVLLLTGLAAICFGASLYATGHVSSWLPLAWVILPARLLGVLVLALPLLAAGRLRPRLLASAWPLVLGAGLCEVLGFASFTLGARRDVAVTAVVACQFAALSAIVAFLLWGERLGRVQLAGVLVLLAGISVLSGIRG